MLPSLENALSTLLSRPVKIIASTRVGGGSINDAFCISLSNGDSFFVKRNNAKRYPGLFAAEQRGLQILQQFIRTPQVLLQETLADFQVIVMEWIAPGVRTTGFWEDFGTALAKLHQQSAAAFGLDHDNYMGSLPQANGWRETWVEFFRERRLQAQIKMAFDKNLLSSGDLKLFERLYLKLPEIFAEEPPSLLHGDLWSGNFICSTDQEPVLIDPAVYYGHRSIDLAITTLFGRFDQRFYEAYHERYPFPTNYQEQWDTANLYPLLVHLNLFGSSYREEILSILKKIW